MTREDFLKSKEYWLVNIQNDLFNLIEGYLEKNKLSKTALAKQLNVTKGYITQVLNGDFDHKLSKFVELTLACDKVPIVHFVNTEQYIKDDAQNKQHIYQQGFKPVEYRLIVQQQSTQSISTYKAIMNVKGTH